MMEKEDDYTASFCPSFSSYTGDRTAETAERVRLEFPDDEEEFEFVNVRSNCDIIFPIFDSAAKSEALIATVTTQLRDLFLNDSESCENSSLSSSEEEDELEGISSEMYCTWTPEKSINRGCRKSKSTGSSSRQWRIKDLLKRSYSEGKQSLSFLSSNSRNRDEPLKKMKVKKEKVSSSAHEKFYLKNKAMKEEEKRKSYLPYKQDLVGFFFNVNRYGNTLPPF